MSLFDKTLTEIHNGLKKKEFSVADLVDASYKRIAEVDGKVKAFLALDEERARERAKKLDEQLNNGEEMGLLFGLPAGDNVLNFWSFRHDTGAFVYNRILTSIIHC